MKNKSRINIRKIRSLQDLHSEKLRLKGELLITKDSIHSNYRHILDVFSFRNIMKTVTEDIALATTAFSKALSIGKKLLEKVKMKKKKNNPMDYEEIKME